RAGRVLVCIAASVFAALLMVAWSPAHADDSEARPAEGPYFHIASDDPSTDRLPLKSTRVDVRIAGVIADVTVTQQYKNEGQRPIEARYVFPGSTRAAVHAMNVRLGDRLLAARIQEKHRARLEYEAAKKEGKTSALLEQERPNVFQMNVANILPGDDVRVELHYTELIAPTEGRYQFVFPTVVGPRYHRPASAGGSSGFPASPYLHAGEPSNTLLEMNVTLSAPLPISDVSSPSHTLEVQGEGGRQVQVYTAGHSANNRDFMLDYRLGGEHTATGLMLYQGPEENFFLALVEPPKAIAPSQINPRDYIFVVDISGSMHGYPLDTAKVLLRELIGHLRPSDSFNVMLFSGSNRMLNDASVPATRANIERAIQTIERMGGSGSTEIVPALKRVAALPKSPDVSRTVIVVTDGYVTVENEVFQLVRRNLGIANVFAFGIGTSVNRHLIEGIARAGQGEPFIVTKPEQAARQAERLRHMIDSPVLTQLKARFEGLDVYDVEPAQLPDVLGGRPVLIYGKWRGSAAGRLILDGRSASGDYREVVEAPAPDTQSVALRHLWARQRIQQLSDQEALQGGDTQRDAITGLGLKYSLLTQYTSFIAVDHVVRSSERSTAVDQPSPMPQGVSDAAIGAEVPSTPEPAAWLALLVVVVLVGAAVCDRRLW
ncbi:MAG TPA: VIT domain-containing protein, partial [Burkholderiaceae bacterium]|nr:VIT domain-containing protein [Burkholderiaceae bacterium]